MTEDLNGKLNGRSVKFLTYLVYVLLGFITILTAVNYQDIRNMPNQYVRLERYKSDISRLEEVVQHGFDKMEKQLERNAKQYGNK